MIEIALVGWAPGLDNGLAPNRRKEQIHWRIDATVAEMS